MYYVDDIYQTMVLAQKKGKTHSLLHHVGSAASEDRCTIEEAFKQYR